MVAVIIESDVERKISRLFLLFTRRLKESLSIKIL